jgi:hypothetical protein
VAIPARRLPAFRGRRRLAQVREASRQGGGSMHLTSGRGRAQAGQA